MYMDILDLSKNAWDNIGEKAVPPKFKSNKYLGLFNQFCNKLPKNAVVLDLGCGPGLPITKELVDRGFMVTGVDISDTMIELAKKNVPRAEYLRISMTDINFNNEFDGVVSAYSMLCLDPDRFKRTSVKISNALKRGGFFILSLNEPPPGGHDEAENYTEIMGQKAYSRPYTENEVMAIFSKLNMEAIKVERETVSSKAYGDEYALMILMQKL
jgi:SAM-dependent methyltransferase